MEEEVELLEENTSSDLFLNNINAILSVKKDYEKKEYDYEWIDMIDETLPYLDNIYVILKDLLSTKKK